MTTLHHVKKARKPQQKHGIKRGDSYFWWAFRQGGRSVKHVSKERPRRSQWQTQSSFLRQLLDAEDEVQEAVNALLADEDWEAFGAAVEAVADNVRLLGEEQLEKRDNQPGSLREGAPGERLAERAEACKRISEELIAAIAEGVMAVNSLDWSTS